MSFPWSWQVPYSSTDKNNAIKVIFPACFFCFVFICPLAFTSLQHGTMWFVCYRDLHHLTWYDNETESFLHQSSFKYSNNTSACVTILLILGRNSSPGAFLNVFDCCCVVCSGVAALCTDCCWHCWEFCCCKLMLSHFMFSVPLSFKAVAVT